MIYIYTYANTSGLHWTCPVKFMSNMHTTTVIIERISQSMEYLHPQTLDHSKCACAIQSRGHNVYFDPEFSLHLEFG